MNLKNNKKTAIFLIVCIIIISAGLGFTTLDRNPSSYSNLENIPVFKVRKGPLKINVVESGTIRPRDQLILRNDMYRMSTILTIVPEGKRVKKGELLFELDATELELRYQTDQLEVQNDKAEFISARENLEIVKNQAEADIDQAELNLRFAEQDLKKYQDGEYPKLLNDASAAIVIAEEELNQAEHNYKWAKILHEEKYLSQSEFQQRELTYQKAQLNLKGAKESLELLKKYTHLRQLEQLKSDLKQARMALERTRIGASANITDASARYLGRQEGYEDEVNDLQELKEEIEKAHVYAPIDGIALYASSVLDNWDDNEDRIRVGATVDERREIIFLVTAETYNVDIQIQETDLKKVKPGQDATITVDALPDETYRGTVKTVSPLPDQRQRYLNPNLKVYNTDIEIEGDTSAMRNGMSCMAEIVVEEYGDAVYVPIQAVMKVNGQSTVFVRENNRIEARPVTVGLDNNKMIHIKSGLEEDESVLLKPPLNVESNGFQNVPAKIASG